MNLKNINPSKVYLLAIIMLLILAIGPFSLVAQSTTSTIPPDFKGKLLLALSDADMVSSAYDDGKIGPNAGKDALSLIPLEKKSLGKALKAVQVSNSVVGPPAALAVSPDGRYAIVIETLGGRPPANKEQIMKNMPPGKTISVVNISDPNNPKIVQQITGNQQKPIAVCINHLGNLVAITYASLEGKQNPLLVFNFSSGRLSDPSNVKIPGWGSKDELIAATFYADNTLALVIRVTLPWLFTNLRELVQPFN